MTAKIIPLLRLGKQCGFFDYTIPPDLTGDARIGSLVAMTFRNKKTQGIIWKIEDEAAVPTLKVLEKLVKKVPYLSIWQMEFLEWFAAYYHISLAHATSIFIPAQPLRSTRKSPQKNTSIASADIFDIHHIEVQPASSLRIASDWHEMMATVKSLCSDILQGGTQALIISPSIHDADIIQSVLQKFFPQKSICVTGANNKTSLANAYDLFSEEMCNIAVTTRMSLGWHMPSLSHVIVLDPESRDHKQYDKNPRYDTRTIADYLVQSRNVSLTEITFSPSCEMIERSTRENIPIIQGSSIVQEKPILADLTLSFKNGNFTFLSDELQGAMRNALDMGKGVFLYLNLKGYGGLVRCNNCSGVFSCAQCKLPQRYSRQHNTLRCTACSASQPFSGQCATCSSHDLSFPGIGIEKIAQSVRIAFPDIPLYEVSAESPLPSEAIKDFSHSIFVGTSHFLQQYWERLGEFGCVGAILADPIQSLSDFRSCEYQWHYLMRIRSTAQTFSIPFIAQSFEVSSVPMQSLETCDWRAFADWQLEQRKRFQWPPSSRIIKIIARHHTLSIPNFMQTLMKTLQHSLTPLKGSVALFRSQTMQSGDRPYLLIRINGPFRSTDPLPDALESILPSLLDDWLIDIDPVTF